MGKEVLKFGNIEKNKFYHHKSPVPLRDVDSQKVLVSNNFYFGEKAINTLLVICIMTVKLNYCI